MEIELNTNLIDDKKLSINILKVGQEHCSPRKKPENCKRPCYALHLVMFGRGTLIDGSGKKYEISKNDAFILYENESYTYCPDIHDPWSYIWVEFNGTEIDKLLSLCGFEKDSISKHIKDFNEFIMLMRDMYESYDASEVQQLRCSAYLMLVLGKFIEQEQALKISPRNAQKKKQLRNILVYINNNYASAALSNETIAQLHGMSVRSLTMLFAEVLGMSPVEYINAYRISVACERLQVANLGVTDAAHWAGFDDEKYFSRVFKSIKGISPLEYKKIGTTEDPFAWIKEKGMLFR